MSNDDVMAALNEIDSLALRTNRSFGLTELHDALQRHYPSIRDELLRVTSENAKLTLFCRTHIKKELGDSAPLPPTTAPKDDLEGRLGEMIASFVRSSGFAVVRKYEMQKPPSQE